MNDAIKSWADKALEQSDKLRSLSIEAGRRIMEIYERGFKVVAKDDSSPLTEADLASHQIILDGLKTLSGTLGTIPVISEEGVIPDYRERSSWEAWWLIDPLDGTKEFVKRNGEFTVNIALIVRQSADSPGVPIAGWVYAPVLKRLYQGILGKGAVRIDVSVLNLQAPEAALPLEKPADTPRIVASRSHQTPETDTIIRAVTHRYGRVEIINSGSSLKLCQVAEGTAELYPRPAPTMEWDTGAADAVCRAAGVRVVQAMNGDNLEYGKENLLNPWFLVTGDDTLISISIRALKEENE